jgi:hypothetical protein
MSKLWIHRANPAATDSVHSAAHAVHRLSALPGTAQRLVREPFFRVIPEFGPLY